MSKYSLHLGGTIIEIDNFNDLFCVSEQILGERCGLEAQIDEILDSYTAGLNTKKVSALVKSVIDVDSLQTIDDLIDVENIIIEEIIEAPDDLLRAKPK